MKGKQSWKKPFLTGLAGLIGSVIVAVIAIWAISTILAQLFGFVMALITAVPVLFLAYLAYTQKGREKIFGFIMMGHQYVVAYLAKAGATEKSTLWSIYGACGVIAAVVGFFVAIVYYMMVSSQPLGYILGWIIAMPISLGSMIWLGYLPGLKRRLVAWRETVSGRIAAECDAMRKAMETAQSDGR